MSVEGLELYVRGEQAWSRGEVSQAATLLQQACDRLPEHAAAHHLLGKAMAELGDDQRAEALQQRSCELDPGLGWNWFALAELLEQRRQWGNAAVVFRQALAALPQEGWIEELSIRAHHREVLGGEDLAQGLGPNAYRHWCEQLEPRLPSDLVPVRQQWVVLGPGEPLKALLPLDGWIVVLGSGCVLRPRALQALEAWLLQRPPCDQPQLVSADEDELDSRGHRCNPWFKPASLAESSWSTPWLESFTAWSCAWLRLKGFAPPPSDPQEPTAWIWTALRAHPRHSHFPTVLVHRHQGVACSPDPLSQCSQVKRHLELLGERIATVQPHPLRRGGFRLEWALPKGLRCTVIVPTRNRADLLQACLSSCEQTNADGRVELEWIVVDNGSDQAELAELLVAWRERLGVRMRWLSDSRPFNWSVLNNQAAQLSSAELLLFLNNDVEAARPGWLTAMAAQAMRPVVGCVGAVLLYPDGAIQHAGVVVAMAGGAEHAYRHQNPSHAIHRGRSAFLSDWGAVTGACMMIKRELFERSGGFDPALPVEFNDIDFCLRLGTLGFRHVVTPEAVLIHRECESRNPEESPTAAAAHALMRRRWGQRLQHPSPWWPEAASSLCCDGRPQGLEQLTGLS